jgi:hypothetical protein
MEEYKIVKEKKGLSDKKFKRLFQIALLAGVIILSLYDKEGWGWLLCLLFFTI